MLFEQIKTDVTKAQKERNAVLLGVLRLLVSELRYKEIPPVGGQVAGELTDEVVIGVLQKEAKKRIESIEIYEKVGDKARTDVESYELEVISAYLPKMMTEIEVEIEVDKIAAESPLRGGQLVGVVMGKLRGKADGGLVARIINERYK
ncbi:GatB/YqeY domain-containing protein [Candidatus Collierbacteria bacterium]|nr:GatB/YqeY domain-containing protein [Candidatus Collierbacteria bacterium]